MDDTRLQLEAELRRRVSRLLDDHAKWKSPRTELLDRLARLQEPAYLFGGTVRDIMLRSPYHAFRDIDVVVRGTTTSRLRAEFDDYIARETRFGGLHLNAKGWLFDVWPLEDTWAIRQFPNLLTPDPQSLPRTTFMTIEAVLVHLNSERGRPREVYECGFFEALATRTIELNFEHTPYPVLNIVRSLLTAWRLQFSIGPRLAEFICRRISQLDMAELVTVQKHHYGRIVVTEDVLSDWTDRLSQWHRQHPSCAMPVQPLSQLSFNWSEATSQV